MFQVLNVDTGQFHGTYDSIEDARGAVLFDAIADWEIWRNGESCVEYGLADIMRVSTE